jgi:hypothetical protein
MRFLIPLILLASVAHATTVTVQWDANSPADQVILYKVYWSNYSGNSRSFPAIGSVSVPGTMTQATISNIPDDAKLYFRATASNATMESPVSEYVYLNFLKKPASLKFKSIEVR